MTTDPEPIPLRSVFREELDQLRMQIEVMGIRVDQNLERMRQVLRDADVHQMDAALAADDEIDDMHLSLLEQCYGLLNRESPMASDLRFIVSAVRILGELERIGDLALRVAKLAPDREMLAARADTFDILLTMAGEAVELYRTSLRAWSSQDLEVAGDLAEQSCVIDA
jgi:phosphate transport system protein